MPTPNENPELFSHIILAGQRSPGTATIAGGNQDWLWDIRKPLGRSGTYLLYRGRVNVEFSVSFYLVDDADVTAWDSFKALIDSNKGARPRAMSIYHPDLARNLITDVVAKSIGSLVHDGKDGATVTVKFVQYRPSKRRPASRVEGAKNTPNDPNAELRAEVQALIDQAGLP